MTFLDWTHIYMKKYDKVIDFTDTNAYNNTQKQLITAFMQKLIFFWIFTPCLLYTSPSPRDRG